MAYTFIANTYAGEALAEFMASTLLEGDSVSRGLLTVHSNVKKRLVLLDVDDDVILQDPSARFVDQNTNEKQNESYLDPVKYEFMKEQNWTALIQSWESQSLKPGSLQDYDGDVDLSNFLLARYTEKLAIANERLIWLGKQALGTDATFAAAYPGLLPRIAANGSVYKMDLKAYAVAATAISATGLVTVADSSAFRDGDVVTIQAVTGAIKDTSYVAAGIPVEGQSYFIKVVGPTSLQLNRNYNNINKRQVQTFTGTATAASLQFINVSNVLKVLSSVYAQIDYADRMQLDIKIMVPLHVIFAYKAAQAEKAVNVLNAFTDDKSTDYLGMKLEALNHWLGNTILVARTSNLFLGVDLLSDDSTLQTVDLRNYTLDQVVRIKAAMKSDSNVKFFNEVLFLSPSN